jgi:protein SCO1/2
MREWQLITLGVGLIQVAQAREFSIRGIVQSPADQGAIIIAHEPVPGYMPAMTMPFVVAPDEPTARDLRRGDIVEFKLTVEDGGSRATAFRRVGHDSTLDATGAAATPATSIARMGERLPAFALTDKNGASVTDRDLLGKYTVVAFVNVPEHADGPAPSPLAAQLRGLEAAASDWQSGGPAPLQILIVNAGPQDSGATAPRANRDLNGAGDTMLRETTGSPATLASLSRFFGQDAHAKSATSDHSVAVVLTDPRGRIIGTWSGLQWTAEDILRVARGDTKPRAQ